MPLTHAAPADDQEIARYLLGLLDDDETERLDQASFEDDDFAVRLRRAEADLIDDYVRRTLPDGWRSRFESFYLSTDSRRERVAFAGRFLAMVDRAAAAGVEPRQAASSSAGSFADVIRRLPGQGLLLGGAAAAMLLLAVGLWRSDSGGFRPPLTVAEPGGSANPAPAVESQVAVSQPPPADIGQDGGSEPTRRSAPAGDRSRLPAASPGTDLPGERRLIRPTVLQPQMRAGESVAEVVVPLRAERAVFELRLEPIDGTRFEARLRDPASSAVVWRSRPLEAGNSGEGPSVVVSVPARLLSPKYHSLELVLLREGVRESAGTYTFRVLPR